ncbi:LLM class F420-dependent oxidoreductase [Nocardia sp. NPDC001965]
MRFIFHYPETGGVDADVLDPGPLGEVARTAEQAGFAGFSLSEHPAPGARWLHAGGHQTLDPFVSLGYAAALTQRIRLITYLSVAPYRNPMLLAKAAATLDKLSGGRAVLGIGTGYLKGEFHAVGVDFEERNTLFDETLDVLPLHWRGEPFSYTGKHFSARDVQARPMPVQQPIPIWIGGNSALSRRRVARAAHGWIPMSGGAELSSTARTPQLGTLEDLARKIADIRSAAADGGRTDHIDLVYSYNHTGLTGPGVDPGPHREAFAELARAGVDWITVSTRAGVHDTLDPAVTFDFLMSFGADYIE